MKKKEFLSEMQVKYVEDIIFLIDTANLGMSRKEAIYVISDIGKGKSFFKRTIT